MPPDIIGIHMRLQKEICFLNEEFKREALDSTPMEIVQQTRNELYSRELVEHAIKDEWNEALFKPCKQGLVTGAKFRLLQDSLQFYYYCLLNEISFEDRPYNLPYPFQQTIKQAVGYIEEEMNRD
jgi:hypothetical protein